MTDGIGATSGEPPSQPQDLGESGAGWAIVGGESGWSLVKDYGFCVGRIRMTTVHTCAWRIGRPDGSMLREASARSVLEAKDLADAWVAARRARDT